MKDYRTFEQLLSSYPWNTLSEQIHATTSQDVENALSQNANRTFEDFLALISPAATKYLPTLQQLSFERTRRRFGNTMQMYVPLYLSNECQNICTYCGFSFNNKIPRLTLNDEQIKKEAEAIQKLGFQHVLVVTGEAQRTVGVDYLEHAIQILKPYFSQITLEVQPLKEDEYKRLSQAGMYGVLVYQETYHRERYKEHHPKGKKSNFAYRLETPERLGRAEIHKIGLGALIGLEDWRVDSAFTALHLLWLQKKFWKTRFSVSFPRLRPAEGLIDPKSVMSDDELLQLICAYRLLDENVELSLSTRESQEFREIAVLSGITSISAGSRTEPGGYAIHSEALKQFEIHDDRSPAEVASMLQSKGLEPVWKDWDAVW